MNFANEVLTRLASLGKIKQEEILNIGKVVESQKVDLMQYLISSNVCDMREFYAINADLCHDERWLSYIR